MTSAERRPFDADRARELLGVDDTVRVVEYTEEPRFVNSDRCEWRLDDDGIVRCLPKSAANPCEYCARLRLEKDGAVEIHCVCWS